MTNLSSFVQYAKTFEPGQIIFAEYESGDSFFLIQSGKVLISKLIGGKNKTLTTLGPPDFFGEMAILERAPRSATVQAIEQTKVLEFNQENFDSLLIENPQVALRLLKIFAKRIGDQRRRLMNLSISDPQFRVTDVFLMLLDMGIAVIPPEAGSPERKRSFSLTLADLANWAALELAEVRSIVNGFAKQQKIVIYPDKIEVPSINEFSRQIDSYRKRFASETSN